MKKKILFGSVLIVFVLVLTTIPITGKMVDNNSEKSEYPYKVGALPGQFRVRMRIIGLISNVETNCGDIKFNVIFAYNFGIEAG